MYVSLYNGEKQKSWLPLTCKLAPLVTIQPKIVPESREKNGDFDFIKKLI